jgi:[ribosomal protein S18]-alanine N-acetyltransferase
MASVIFDVMTLDDVQLVGELERVCFTAPWSEETFRSELRHNPRSFYYVVRPDDSDSGLPPIMAYGGYWILGDEAHIVTLASHPDYRQQSLGEYVLLHLIDRARQAAVEAMTLEVRVSNLAAQRLYEKWGFETVGVRKRYYRDNGEDGLVMTLSGVDREDVWMPMAEHLLRLEANLSIAVASA